MALATVKPSIREPYARIKVFIEEEKSKIALQILPKRESLYGLVRHATKFKGFVWRLATFARLPFGQFCNENSQTWLGSDTVEMLRFWI